MSLQDTETFCEFKNCNLSGTCNALFLERGDKKLYNLKCVGGRIAQSHSKCVCVVFANVTDPFNMSILTLNKLLYMLEIYLR